MASPWKFLARLTSRRRGSKEQQDVVIDNVTLEEAVSSERVDAATDNTQISSARQVEPRPAYQSDAGMPVPEHSAGSRAQGKAYLESAKLVDAAGAALSDDADFTTTRTHEALTFSSSKRRRSAKRKRSQQANAVKVVPQVQASVPTFSDEVQSLDEEIRLLRDQLARKLQLQNAQLRMMLERFER